MATKFVIKKWVNDPKNTAKAAVSKKANAPMYYFDKGTFKPLVINVRKDLDIGLTSGRGVTMTNGYTYWLVTLKTPVGKEVYVYVSIQDFYLMPVTPKTDDKSAAQKLLDALIGNDQELYDKCIRNWTLLSQLEKKGQNVSKEKKAVIDVFTKLKVRQYQIDTCPFFRISKKESKKGISGIESEIGEILTIALIAAGVVLAGFIAYQWLKPEYDASKVHSQYLDDNEAELRKALGDQKFNELKEQVNSEMKESAQDAYGEGKWDSKRGFLKNALLIGGGIFVFTKFQKGKQ